MTGIPGFVGFAVDEDVTSSLVKRQQGCLLCPDEPPDCPACAADESCLTISQTCQQCSNTVCMKDPTKISANSNSGPNAGAIAGGVIGGLVLVAALTYLLWKFCIKNKRGSYEEQWRGDGERTKEHAENDFASRRSQRESTHTVNSIASTVLTRASNIIQIAYIPGVTNRATPTSPTLLVPPVPPIPIVHTESATSSPYEDQHFFVPGDLRDSTYSGISSYTDRTSYARTSYAPRSSVASTIYGKNLVVSPVPAQKGNFLKPSIVSVTRTGSTNSDESTPPVPSVNYEKYEKPPPSPAFSIGSTFLKNASASTATSVRPQVVRVGSGPKTVDIKGSSSKSLSPSTTTTTTTIAELESPDSPAHMLRKDAGQGGGSAASTPIEEGSPTSDQGPFSDPPPMKIGKKNNSSLSAVIEESTRRASQIDPHRYASSTIRNSSPFGDENAVRE